MPDGLVAAARTVAPVARAAAEEGERSRHLAPGVVDALADAGLLTMCLPEAYGGPGADPLTFLEAIETVSAGDGAAGWITMIGSTTSSMAAFMEADAVGVVFPSAAAKACGVFAPNGAGMSVDAGYRITGRWQWGSGSHHAAWIMGGALCDDGTQRSCFFPAAEVDRHDTWYTSGLRGTGSADFSVEDVFVPRELTIQPGVSRPTVDEPAAHFPSFTLLAIGVAAASIGIGRAALDEVTAIAADKRPQFSSRTIAASGYAQTEIAKAESRWRSARAYLHDETARAWDIAQRGDVVPVESRVGMRLAATNAATACAAVTDIAYTLAGGSAVFDSSSLGRHTRDAHVVTQHIMVAPKINETLGRFLMGVEFDARMI